ncbi:hypothetical protein SRB5_36180 [Streptomyces sp. RB5]|uniref:Uncharacterized protein n=1 Tax=Streptomyces smaragdinus TaxID=2585196 RepID=A0A7K0CJ11_9ACTN|nr:CU044_5270 family protein [Streptomyces smaragdinus]MQY13470.1 hypothetical protein [Streptomyces smaragdinus]
MSRQEQHDVLDFPGADTLIAAGAVPEPDPAVLVAAHAALRTASSAVTVRPHRRRGFLAAAVAVAAATAAGVVVPVVDTGGGGPSAEVAAAAFFDTVADRAQRAPDDGPYWKITERESLFGGAPMTHTTYLAPDRMLGGDGTEWKPVGVGPGGQRKQLFAGPNWLVGDELVGWDEVRDLPADPAALRRRLSEGAAGGEANAQVVRQAGELLSRSPARADVRAALYRVMARTPGAEVRPGARDTEGRRGTEVSWTYDQPDEQGITANPHWIVDPSTGAMLEQYGTAAAAYDGRGCEPSEGVDGECPLPLAAGDPVARTTYLFNGPVASLP